MRWLALGLLVWGVASVIAGFLAGPWLNYHADRRLGPPKGPR